MIFLPKLETFEPMSELDCFTNNMSDDRNLHKTVGLIIGNVSKHNILPYDHYVQVFPSKISPYSCGRQHRKRDNVDLLDDKSDISAKL